MAFERGRDLAASKPPFQVRMPTQKVSMSLWSGLLA
jgi:hypothetical protein